MQRFKYHFQIVLAFHEIRTHQESSSFVNYLLENLCVFLLIFEISFCQTKSLLKFVPLLIFVDILLVKLSHPCLIGSLDVFQLLITLLVVIFCLSFFFCRLTGCNVFLSDGLFNSFLFLLLISFESLNLVIKLLTLSFLCIKLCFYFSYFF